MRGVTRLPFIRIFGAPLRISWTVYLACAIWVAVSFRQPIHAALLVLSYLSIMLIHEAGHALVARRLGCTVHEIYLGIFHGHCLIDAPATIRDECLIAWGGVLAQLLVAVPLIIIARIGEGYDIGILNLPATYLGYFSVFVAAFNLLPISNLDGAKAWRLVPIYWRQSRTRKTKASRRHLRVVK